MVLSPPTFFKEVFRSFRKIRIELEKNKILKNSHHNHHGRCTFGAYPGVPPECNSGYLGKTPRDKATAFPSSTCHFGRPAPRSGLPPSLRVCHHVLHDTRHVETLLLALSPLKRRTVITLLPPCHLTTKFAPNGDPKFDRSSYR